jgi:3-dehydroquinate synthase
LRERSYDIEIGTGILSEIGHFVADREPVSHAIVVTDENVERLHGVHAAESMAEVTDTVDLTVVEPGENSKAVGVAEMLWGELLELNADRKSVVLAVGGGVIGDLAGFVAATYARGIHCFQVPTTLLAQVDSSVGGKVGINLPRAKNMVGVFAQPRGVFIDTQTLDTLPDRDYRSGLAEVIKYGVILDEEFFAFLEAHAEAINRRDHAVLRRIVSRCCRLKADVVEKDEREESGLRAMLNYGHTFGHAFETLSGYGTFLHGEAVALGMLCAARLAHRLRRIDRQTVARQHALIEALRLPLHWPKLDYKNVLNAMTRDKKVEHGKLRFVLPSRLGHVELVGDIPDDDVAAALENG